MEKEAYRQQFELEENFFWFSGRKKAIETVLGSFLNGKETQLSILDVGCGTGGLFEFFKRYGKVWGLDLSPEALYFCRKRNFTRQVVQGSALSLPFCDGRFDLIAACDILYHRWVEDDLSALRECYRVCKKGGHLLLTDSAFEWLKGSHDRFFHGIRRYTTGTLRPKIEKNGFRIERLSYTNLSLFPFLALWRNLRRDHLQSDLRPLSPFLNQGLTWLLWGEAALLRYWNFPLGSSLICLAKKV